MTFWPESSQGSLQTQYLSVLSSYLRRRLWIFDVEREGAFLVDDQNGGVILLQAEQAEVAHSQKTHQQNLLQT